MWNIIGHERAVSYLDRSLTSGGIGHAYLLSGPPRVGKMAVAVQLAQALNCPGPQTPCLECVSCHRIGEGRHADVQVIACEAPSSPDTKAKTEISIEQVRDMQAQSALSPFEGRCRVFIIDGVEYLSLEAANRMLKTLEEPPAHVVFILLTANDEFVPATLVSRCQRLELMPVATTELEAALIQRSIEPERARLLARLSHGRPGWALSAIGGPALLEQRAGRLEKFFEIINGGYESRFDYAAGLAEDFGKNRRSVVELLDLWADWWRDLLLVKAGAGGNMRNFDYRAEAVAQAGGLTIPQIKSTIQEILSAGEALRRNANARLALEVLMLNIPKKEGRGARKAAAH